MVPSIEDERSVSKESDLVLEVDCLNLLGCITSELTRSNVALELMFVPNFRIQDLIPHVLDCRLRKEAKWLGDGNR